VDQQVGPLVELDQSPISASVTLDIGGKDQFLAVHFDAIDKDPLRVGVAMHDPHPDFPGGALFVFTVDVAHLRRCIWFAKNNHLAFRYVTDNPQRPQFVWFKGEHWRQHGVSQDSLQVLVQ